jgi:hypothetical protein
LLSSESDSSSENFELAINQIEEQKVEESEYESSSFSSSESFEIKRKVKNSKKKRGRYCNA